MVVYNPLNIEREDVVEATISFPGNTPKAVRVVGPGGHEVPAQVENGKVLFLAKAPSVGYAVYDIRRAKSPHALNGTESKRIRAGERALSRFTQFGWRCDKHLR